MLNWSNLDEDYMGILNCCTLGLPLCFSKDGTDRQAFSYIYKEVIYIYIFFFMHLFSQKVKLVLCTEKADCNDLLLAS